MEQNHLLYLVFLFKKNVKFLTCIYIVVAETALRDIMKIFCHINFKRGITNPIFKGREGNQQIVTTWTGRYPFLAWYTYAVVLNNVKIAESVCGRFIFIKGCRLYRFHERYFPPYFSKLFRAAILPSSPGRLLLKSSTSKKWVNPWFQHRNDFRLYEKLYLYEVSFT